MQQHVTHLIGCVSHTAHAERYPMRRHTEAAARKFLCRGTKSGIGSVAEKILVSLRSSSSPDQSQFPLR